MSAPPEFVLDTFANREGNHTKRPDPIPIFNNAFFESILLKLPTNGVLHRYRGRVTGIFRVLTYSVTDQL